MSQRVNIQYSLRFDELAGEVKRLLDNTQLKLQELADVESISASRALSLETLRAITIQREGLAEVDHKLMDIMNIINGYISFHTNETYNTQREQLERDVSRDPTPAQTLEELRNNEITYQG